MLLSDITDKSDLNKALLKQKAYALSDKLVQNAIKKIQGVCQ
jgi:hypothetical protein